MKNKKYWLDKDKVKSSVATKEELELLREEARKLLKKTNGSAMGMRSCWNCNPAHEHFLSGDWGKWVLMCFAECGKYYYKGVDITEDSL